MRTSVGRFVFCGTLRHEVSQLRCPCVSRVSELRGVSPCGVRTFLPRACAGSDSPPFQSRWDSTRSRGREQAREAAIGARTLNIEPLTERRRRGIWRGTLADDRRLFAQRAMLDLGAEQDQVISRALLLQMNRRLMEIEISRLGAPFGQGESNLRTLSFLAPSSCVLVRRIHNCENSKQFLGRRANLPISAKPKGSTRHPAKNYEHRQADKL